MQEPEVNEERSLHVSDLFRNSVALKVSYQFSLQGAIEGGMSGDKMSVLPFFRRNGKMHISARKDLTRSIIAGGRVGRIVLRYIEFIIFYLRKPVGRESE